MPFCVSGTCDSSHPTYFLQKNVSSKMYHQHDLSIGQVEAVLKEVAVDPLAQQEMEEMKGIHPGRLTWNLKMMVWKMMFLFNWVIFRFHVNLPGCTVDGRNFCTS